VLAFSVIYDWRLHDQAQALAARMPHIGKPYSPAADDSQRKAIACPLPVAAAGAAAPATGVSAAH